MTRAIFWAKKKYNCWTPLLRVFFQNESKCRSISVKLDLKNSCAIMLSVYLVVCSFYCW